jgi:hypothetical protein
MTGNELGGLDNTGDGMGDTVRGLGGIGLAGDHPGDHGFNGQGPGELAGPLRPPAVRDERRDVTAGDVAAAARQRGFTIDERQRRKVVTVERIAATKPID